MKKNIFFLSLSILYLIFDQSLCFAATATATPTKYEITINRIRVKNSASGEWITVGEGDLTFDISQANAGQAVGSYISGKAISEGTYQQVEVKVKRDMNIISAYTDTNGATFGGGVTTVYYTTAVSASGAVTTNNTGPAVTGVSTIPGSSPCVSGDYCVQQENFTTPLVVEKGKNRKMRIKFDVTNKVTFDDSGGSVVAYCTQPTVTQEIVE